MREILFRGKTCNGEWVQGLLASKDGKWYISNKAGMPFAYEIRPETGCQFTGLTDKNGKKVFEGDVVKAVIVRDLGGSTQNREETGIIGYDKIGMIGLIAKYAGTIPVWSDFFQELTLSGCIDDFWFEVIGNIFDNPELMKGGEADET